MTTAAPARRLAVHPSPLLARSYAGTLAWTVAFALRDLADALAAVLLTYAALYLAPGLGLLVVLVLFGFGAYVAADLSRLLRRA